MKKWLVIAALFVITGCSFVHPKPQEGGSASVSPPSSEAPKGQINGPSGSFGMPGATITQPQNPNSTSKQDVEYEFEETVEVAVDTVNETTTVYPDGRSVTIKQPIPAGSRVIRKAKSIVNQEIGGSWKDTARELGVALASFQAVQYIGIAVFLFGSASFFNMALLKLVGGKDGAMVVAGAGLVMMFGPFLFVKYSKWFFLAIVLAGLYWLFARFKYQHGLLDALKEQPPK